MLEKNKTYFFNKLIYSKLIIKKQTNVCIKLKLYQTIYTFNFSRKEELKSTGFFYKKLAFMGLAINTINFKSYYTTTLKSTVRSLWTKIAAYTPIL